MERHTKNYLEYFNYDGISWIACECCGGTAVDIHHIIFRSKFGSKRKNEQDDISNLIGLCRECHEKAHNGTYDKDYLKEIHNAFMGK